MVKDRIRVPESDRCRTGLAVDVLEISGRVENYIALEADRKESSEI